MNIRAILFAAAGTLIYLPRGVAWHYREIAARHGLEIEEARLGPAFRDAFKAATLSRAAGSRGNGESARPDDDKHWWRALVRQVIAGCGHQPPDAHFDPLFEELYAHFAQPGVWALYPEVETLLAQLHGQYRLGILSNFDRRLYPVLEHLRIRHYFDSIVISSEIGFDKPHPRAFAAALSRLGVTAAETIHAGDEPEQDWRGAENAGLHVYRVQRPATDLCGLLSLAP